MHKDCTNVSGCKLPPVLSLAQAGLCSHSACLEPSPTSTLLQAPPACGPECWGIQMSSPETRWGQGRK